MSRSRVDRDFVASNAGIYYFAYSVPEVISANLGLDPELASGAGIFHTSLISSDGLGCVETITAGPATGSAWYKQLGLAPVTVQIAFLAHLDPAMIQSNFDTTAWNDPRLQKIFFSTNWEKDDFLHVKERIKALSSRVSRVGYNLGGHNSNSLTTLVWKEAALRAGTSRGVTLDGPSSVLLEYFRPGSAHDVFDRSRTYYASLLQSWLRIGLTATRSLPRIGGHLSRHWGSRLTHLAKAKWASVRKKRNDTD